MSIIPLAVIGHRRPNDIEVGLHEQETFSLTSDA